MTQHAKLPVRLNAQPMCSTCGSMLLQIEKLRWCCGFYNNCPQAGVIVEQPVEFWPVVGKVERS